MAKRAAAPDPTPSLFDVQPSAPPRLGDSPWLPALPLFREAPELPEPEDLTREPALSSLDEPEDLADDADPDDLVEEEPAPKRKPKRRLKPCATLEEALDQSDAAWRAAHGEESAEERAAREREEAYEARTGWTWERVEAARAAWHETAPAWRTRYDAPENPNFWLPVDCYDQRRADAPPCPESWSELCAPDAEDLDGSRYSHIGAALYLPKRPRERLKVLETRAREARREVLLAMRALRRLRTLGLAAVPAVLEREEDEYPHAHTGDALAWRWGGAVATNVARLRHARALAPIYEAAWRAELAKQEPSLF